MPLFNKEKEVARAIRSVLAQTVDDFELIIVNDGSTDGGPDEVRVFTDKRIRVIKQANSGVSAARNRGIKEAQSDIVAFLDADDEWEPDFLETILRLRSRYPQCVVYATSYFICRPGDRRRAVIRNLPPNFSEGILSDYFLIASHSDPPLWTSAVAVTKEAINSVGGFPKGIIAGEDLLTWARLSVKYDIAYCNKQKAYFWEPLSVSSRPGRVPQTPDRVGNGLQQMMREADSSRMEGVRDYVALWHRMRAVIYVRLGDRSNALKEIRNAMHFVPSTKLFLLFIIASLPGPFPAWVLASLRRIRVSS